MQMFEQLPFGSIVLIDDSLRLLFQQSLLKKKKGLFGVSFLSLVCLDETASSIRGNQQRTDAVFYRRHFAVNTVLLFRLFAPFMNHSFLQQCMDFLGNARPARPI